MKDERTVKVTVEYDGKTKVYENKAAVVSVFGTIDEGIDTRGTFAGYASPYSVACAIADTVITLDREFDGFALGVCDMLLAAAEERIEAEEE